MANSKDNFNRLVIY